MRDRISGADGIVVCRSQWQYGCIRLSVQPETVKDGKPADVFVIDEAQARLVRAQAVPDVREPAAQAAQPAGSRPDAAPREERR